MKKIKFITLVIFLLAGFAKSISAVGEVKEPQLAVSIVLDAASSNRSNWQNIHSLARQAIFSLKENDYFELISADQWDNHIRAAQFIKTGSTTEINNLASILYKIELPLIADAQLMQAVELALDRMSRFTSKNPRFSTVIIVLSDGRITDDESVLARKLAERAKNNGWKLYFTGTFDTNRKMLIDSSNGILNWSLLKDANPSLWIQQQRIAVNENLFAAKKKPEIPKPASSESRPSYEIKSELKSTVSISENKKQNTPIATTSENKPSVPVKISPAKSPIPKKYTTAPRHRHNYLWWLIPIFFILLSISGLWFLSAKYAQQWHQKISKHLSSIAPKQLGTILAKLNGRTFSLGKFNHFSTVYVGSGSKCLIKINEKNITDKHLKITRKSDKLWLKNLSNSNLIVNGIIAKPSSKCRLVLPSIVNINENISIKFELQKPVMNLNMEKSNGNEKSIQPAGHPGNN